MLIFTINWAMASSILYHDRALDARGDGVVTIVAIVSLDRLQAQPIQEISAN